MLPCMEEIYNFLADKDRLSATANVVMALVAIMALTGWKAQKKAAVAEEILLHAHQVKARIQWVRFNGSFEGEGETRKSDAVEDNSTKWRRDKYYIPIERIQESDSLFSTTDVLKLKAKIHFSDDVERKLSEFNKILWNITVDARFLMNEAPAAIDKTSYFDALSTIYHKEGDKIEGQLNQICDSLDQALKNFL